MTQMGDVRHGYPATPGPDGHALDLMATPDEITNDAGNLSAISPTVDGAVTARENRYQELQSDTYGQGSTIGDLMQLPPHLDFSTQADGGQTTYPGQPTI
jgi:hypothetical protein